MAVATADGRKIAVVTGGSAGVGRAAVREFVRGGYAVAVLARGYQGLEGAAKDVESYGGGPALTDSVDVADADAVEEAAERVEQDLGEIDVWVNCAFTGYLAPLSEVTTAEFQRVTEVTYHGQVHGTMAALRRFRPRDRGVIVNVGSAMAYRGIPLQSSYCGAKHAIVGFTESLTTELINDNSNVKACMVQLPGLNTPQFRWVLSRMPQHPRPVAPVYQPELAGRAIRFIAEHPRRNMWVGISTAYTILGNRVAPKLLDLFLGRNGIAGQQTSSLTQKLPPNLFEPSDGDQGAHGPFDEEAHARSPQLWLSEHRRAVLSGLAAAVTAGGVALARK